MSNALYDKGRQRFLEGTISILTDTVKMMLIDVLEYTADFQTDEYLNDIPTDARIATSSALSGKSTTNGVFDANDVTLPLVSGPQCEAIVIYKDTGSASTSPLLAYFDTASGLPIIPNGGDIVIQWDNGLNKIFRL